MTARACFIVCWLVLVANVSLGDEIELNNGNVIEGTIVEETDKYVVIWENDPIEVPDSLD
jgi:small-conductance mechanosensitive channel